MISYVLPTRHRPKCLAQTLRHLGTCDPAKYASFGNTEVIVVDNASDPPVQCPDHLANGWPVRVVSLEANHGAAARNIGAERASGQWILMLDDDSYPLDSRVIDVLREVPDDVAAIGAEIVLANGQREAGGLPEVFIGCGVALRRDVFLELGGYDHRFGYYAEEYDLCARLIQSGWRIVHDPRFRVQHNKVTNGRDMNRICHHLVRNNGWVAQRYAPEPYRRVAVREAVDRYFGVARKEDALGGYHRGLAELFETLDEQPRSPLTARQYARFTGAAAARHTLAHEPSVGPGTDVAIVEPGKGARVVRDIVIERGATFTDEPAQADAVVIGTLSPGPMVDAWQRWRDRHVNVLCPWRLETLCDRLSPHELASAPSM